MLSIVWSQPRRDTGMAGPVASETELAKRSRGRVLVAQEQIVAATISYRLYLSGARPPKRAWTVGDWFVWVSSQSRRVDLR